MEKTILGRTGFEVSRMGIGGGGPSQLGRRTGKSEDESVDILCRAFDGGVNFVDTAEGYGTEEIIARALQGRARESVIISTKKSTRHKEVTPQTLLDSIDQSLRHLATDYIDLYNLHGVVPQDYDYLVENIYPALEKARDAGKIRSIGITEMFNEDMGHQTLARAVADGLWDVVMIGFNLLNQTARASVLEKARENNIGVQVMFAVRKAFRAPENLREFVAELVAKGQLDSGDIDVENPLNFLIEEGLAESLTDASYRFCRDEPGVHVVLSGTGNPAHLEANMQSFTRPALPTATTEKLRYIFRNVDSTTGQ
ncbi:MAG: aryl-alcohol dehydrogenase-like predicted oxidoreductase [Candidatus Latescibacterota bacterium]|jgi:aryl-alcohol dehydrogenase-like predicted oxidoreductase